ncbi:Cytochrome c oxidase subunit IV [Popillia japonica]|uniref:Cytochrome c oxidase subunit 4 n=1 Tax=Popillia japonica TaxID=7064 RepID=A0AAW1JGB5_POPJA
MIAYRIGLLGMRPLTITASRIRPSSLQLRNKADYNKYMESMIGNREMVGYGYNGTPFYADLPAFPFPAIRYKENTPEIMALREKEKGDWRLLSMNEKKELYRSSFCQTFAEFQYVTSDWMFVVGGVLISISAGLCLFLLMHIFVYGPRSLPNSFSYISREAQLQRMIDLQVNPIHGLSSNWDYEKKDWKKVGWFTPPNPFLEDEDEEEEEECDD